ncbi:MAG: succinylglutamate desuccinylase/aspartoacylase family protein [Spirochaetaceae bacterium]|nr:succinylglutamate desuccinylase/aspartoacylase family protein [Spirochaetaceae bacterium]
MTEKIITVVSVQLPIDEKLKIQKHRLFPKNQDEKELEKSGRRIAIVTGIHGDELEGQFVCYELCRRIKENSALLSGIVEIYPAMNPFGIDNISRGIPAFDLDMNRIFPGNDNGDMNEYIASQIVNDIEGTELCIDIHASNIFLTEVPQVRINELHKDVLLPYALKSNVDFIWVYGASTVLESTFAYSLNSRNVKILVVEMGVGMRITPEYGNQLVDGIFSLMKDLEIWQGEVPAVRKPIVSNDASGNDVSYLNAPCSGIFIKEKNHGSMVKKGDVIGKIIQPLSGELLSLIKAEEDGWLFTIREYPIVEEGSLMGRILKGDRL